MKKAVVTISALFILIALTHAQLTVTKTLAEEKLKYGKVTCKYLEINGNSGEISIQFYSNDENATNFGIVKLSTKSETLEFSSDLKSIIDIWDSADKSTTIEIIKEKYSLHLVDAVGVSLLLIDRTELDETGRSDLWTSFKLKDAQKLHNFIEYNTSNFPE